MAMSLYQVINELEETLNQFEVDEETGEVIFDADKIEALNLVKEEKITNIGYVILNKQNELSGLLERKKALEKRIKVLNNSLVRLNDYLSFCLDNKPFKCVDFEIKFTKSKRVEIDQELFDISINDRFIKYKAPEPNKAEIKKALELGEFVPGAKLVEHVNMNIK